MAEATKATARLSVTWPISRPLELCEKNIFHLFRYTQPVENYHYSYGEELPQVFGQNHCPRMQKVDFWLILSIFSVRYLDNNHKKKKKKIEMAYWLLELKGNRRSVQNYLTIIGRGWAKYRVILR